MVDSTEEGNASQAGDDLRGGLLSGRTLIEALKRPDHIFRHGSWEPKQVKGAGYELRLAGDLLVIPSRPGASTFRTIQQSDPNVSEFTLNPGDSALVSTQEKFCLDFDVSVLIGPKFRWSARGLLVLHGMVAHPGYGRFKSESGEWIPKEDERLYVIVANIGPNPINMRRGDPIVYVQFFDVEPPAERKPIDNYGFDYLRETLFGVRPDSTDPGLAYFRNIRDLKQSMERLESTIDRRFELLSGRVDGAETAVDRVRNATDNVVVFGVFLVGATILGIVLTTLVGLVRDLPSHLGTTRVAVIAVLAAVYAVSAVVGVSLVGASTRKLGQNRRARRSNPPGGTENSAHAK